MKVDDRVRVACAWSSFNNKIGTVLSVDCAGEFPIKVQLDGDVTTQFKETELCPLTSDQKVPLPPA